MRGCCFGLRLSRRGGGVAWLGSLGALGVCCDATYLQNNNSCTVAVGLEVYFHVQTRICMQNRPRHVVARQVGNGPFRTEITTWALSPQPLASMMECNKLCDEHIIAGSLSNLADGRAARVWGSQVSSRAHHPSIQVLFLFCAGFSPPFNQGGLDACSILGRGSRWRLNPSQRQAQANNHMGLNCSSRMLWPRVSTLPGLHRRHSPICHARGSVSSDPS